MKGEGMHRRRQNIRLWDPFASFARAEDGAVAVITALVLPILIGFAALAFEVSFWFDRKAELQLAADQAVLSGASAYAATGSEAAGLRVARGVAAANGWNTDDALSLDFPGSDRVALSLAGRAEQFLSQAFLADAFNITVRAGAEIVQSQGDGTPCLYLHDDRKFGALRLDRAARLVTEGCEVAVASAHQRSVMILPHATLETDCLYTPGGLHVLGQLSLSRCTNVRTTLPSPAPVDLPSTVPPGKCSDPQKVYAKHPGHKGRTVALSRQPGQAVAVIQFCGGWDIDEDTFGGNGVYFVTGGDLTIQKNATLNLSGATLVLGEKVRLDIRKGGALRITAPHGGKWDGIAVAADPKSSKDSEHILRNFDLTGRFHAPDHGVRVAESDRDQPVLACPKFEIATLKLEKKASLEIKCATEQTAVIRLLRD